MKAFNTPEKISVYTGEKGWHEVAQEDFRPATGADYLTVDYKEKLFKVIIWQLWFTAYVWAMDEKSAQEKFFNDYPLIQSEGIQVIEVQ